MLCIPASLVFGIVGILRDEYKLVAILVTFIAGVVIFFYITVQTMFFCWL